MFSGSSYKNELKSLFKTLVNEFSANTNCGQFNEQGSSLGLSSSKNSLVATGIVVLVVLLPARACACPGRPEFETTREDIVGTHTCVCAVVSTLEWIEILISAASSERLRNAPATAAWTSMES